MQLFFTSLNSGSNGNCYYVGNAREAVLVDAGISCRETEKRIKQLGLSMSKVKAIFVSHEHSDHINGVPVLARKYNLPVYISDATLKHSRIRFNALDFRPLPAHQPVQVGELQVTGFPKIHDAADGHSFVVHYAGFTVGVFTDIGMPCDNLATYFKQCHAAFLEANYCADMLENGSYPLYLKNRIRGGEGHLSNAQALAFFLEHKPPFLKHLLLAHLSKNNNSPRLVKKLFTEHAGQVQVTVASRYEATPVFAVNQASYYVQASLW